MRFRTCAPTASLLSAIVLVPCFWHSHIQAGDLSSHVYNAWLALQIEKGNPHGLVIVTPWTNVLFDLLLSGLARTVGFDAAQRIAVALAVLIFFWGAFTLVCTVTGKRPWFLAPCLAMLAYGWTFHTGLFNFYLSMGLCMWALALASRRTVVSSLSAAALLLLATFAHALPVLWAVCIGGYVWIAPRVPHGLRLATPVFVLGAIVAVQRLMTSLLVCDWSVLQLFSMTGIDQVAVYGTKYFAIAFGLLVFWLLLFFRLLDARGLRGTLDATPFHIVLFAVAIVLLIPTRIQLPGYGHDLSFVAERSSVIVGICVCALLGSVSPNKFEVSLIAIVATFYFSFLYVDTRALNEFEDNIERAVSALPPGRRVVSSVRPYKSHVNALAHTLDRVCIGRCFSYANYELSTGQFRLRALANSPIVVSSYDDSYALQMGTYVVKERDLPLYQVYLAGKNPNDLRVRLLKAGELSGNTWWQAPPFL